MARAFLNNPMKIDRRKHRTHAKLFNAIVAKHQAGVEYKQIEIKEFCESAGVSRATFYRHYQNLADVIVVHFLIVISDFEKQIDDLSQPNFENSSQVVVSEIENNLELVKLVSWSGTQKKVQSVLSGTAQQILILRDYPIARRQFVSEFLGGAILHFAQEVAETSEPIPPAEVLELYRMLIPNDLSDSQQ
ncbi:TetR/AcrR family transcriptional regulator [Secundilactobacillus yichangensis]|uniref:TetR/AcrR family transcriptional regulator n=1 Tax=Secundilactobacillus yichangensis TaxID=2799580 RepID=UPI0019411741|nr:TetR/AcrR family transcriptional regulator [Secundilactobacillus yichangensis]